MKSIFTGKVMETKWSHWTAVGFDVDGWRLNEDYHTTRRIREYIRILDYPIIHAGEFNFILKPKDVINIGDKKCEIEKVEFNSDNSITYFTNHVVSNEVLKSYHEALREMLKHNEEIKKQTENSNTERTQKRTHKTSKVVITLLILALLTFIGLSYVNGLIV